MASVTLMGERGVRGRGGGRRHSFATVVVWQDVEISQVNLCLQPSFIFFHLTTGERRRHAALTMATSEQEDQIWLDSSQSHRHPSTHAPGASVPGSST